MSVAFQYMKSPSGQTTSCAREEDFQNVDIYLVLPDPEQ